MKKYTPDPITVGFIIVVILLLILVKILSPSQAHAEEKTPPPFSPEIQLLFHGTKTLVTPEESKKPSVGLAAWVIEPNLLDANPQAQATAGLRLARPEGWVELLGGAVVSPTTENVASPVFDVRAFVAPARHIHVFGEVSVYADALYGFAQADVPVRKSDGDVAAKIGVEIEGAKTWKGSGGFLAAGPHVIVPWSDHFTTIVAVQVRGKHSPAGPPATDVVGRLYAVIDF